LPGCLRTHVRYPFTFRLCPEGGGLSQSRSALAAGPGLAQTSTFPV
jgi:hypothetical protein